MSKNGEGVRDCINTRGDASGLLIGQREAPAQRNAFFFILIHCCFNCEHYSRRASRLLRHVLDQDMFLIETCPRLLETCPHLLETRPHLLEMRPHLLETHPHLLEMRPHLLETCPHLLETHPHLLETRPHFLETLMPQMIYSLSPSHSIIACIASLPNWTEAQQLAALAQPPK